MPRGITVIGNYEPAEAKCRPSTRTLEEILGIGVSLSAWIEEALKSLTVKA